MSTAQQFVIGWLIGVGIYAALLFGLHLIFTHRDQLARAARAKFRARLVKHIERRGVWS